MKGLYKKYDDEFKLKVITSLKDGSLKSIEEARRVYNIGGKMTISRWAKELGVKISHTKVIKSEDFLMNENQRLLAALGKCYLRIIDLEGKRA